MGPDARTRPTLPKTLAGRCLKAAARDGPLVWHARRIAASRSSQKARLPDGSDWPGDDIGGIVASDRISLRIQPIDATDAKAALEQSGVTNDCYGANVVEDCSWPIVAIHPSRDSINACFNTMRRRRQGAASPRPRNSLAQPLNSRFDRCRSRHFQPEVAGDGVDFRRVERNAAAVDGGDQPARLFDVGRRGFLDAATRFQPVKDSTPRA